MRIYTLIMLFMCSFTSSYSQSYYYDAKEIAENKEKLQKEIQKILNDREDHDSKDIMGIENFNKFLENPFDDSIKPIDYFKTVVLINKLNEPIDSNRQISNDEIKSTNMSVLASLPPDALSPLSSATSSLTVTTKLIDATAQYLVKRTQEELTIAFFDKFRDNLNKVPELEALFPNTSIMIQTQDYFQIPSMGDTWISAIKTDLQSMPENLEEYIQTNPRFKNIKEKDEIKAILRILKIYQYQKWGLHPSEIISTIASEYSSSDSNFLDISMNLLDVFARSIRSMDDDKTWISSDEILSLNIKEKEFFYGLIYQKVKTIDSTIYQMSKDKIDKVFQNTLRLAAILNKVQQSLDEMVKDTSLSNNKKFLVYLDNFFAMITWGLDVFAEVKSGTNSANVKAIKTIIEDTYNMTSSFIAKEYGIGLVYAFKTLRQCEKYGLEIKSYKTFAKYGNFLVDIVTADSTTQMKDIIAKYSMPTGSYTIKRKSPFSIDLNAYPGLYFAQERSDLAPSFAYGITAPIGFSFTWGGDSGSFSIFIPIVDIGAPFSYRWLNDSAEGLPEDIKISQILSLGAHATWGFKGSPFSLMVGVQHTPQLRAIEDGVNKINENKIYRIGITLAVDIPMFNLMY